MTTPAPSPPQALVPKPPRTWRPMVGWTLGILAVLGLAWFVGAVVVPAWRVCRAVESTVSPLSTSIWDPCPRWVLQEAVESWGKPENATASLLLYLRLPQQWAPHRVRAVTMLGFCGESAVPPLLAMLQSHDHNVRAAAARALGESGDLRAVEPLAMFMNDDHVASLLAAEEKRAARLNKGLPKGQLPIVVTSTDFDATRVNAAEALGRIGGDRATQALNAALGGRDVMVCQAAAEALQKIRGEESPK